MHAAADRPEFAPPPQPGMLRAVVLAVLAHLLLVVALTFGLHWQRETENVVAEAELWSQLPQQAAPREAPTPPAPPPPPPAPPVVRAPPLPDPQVQRDAQIALERERAREEAQERRRAELQKQKELERKRKLEAQRKQQEHEEELARRKEEEKRELAEAKKRELAEAKKRDEREKEKKRRQEEQQARQLAQAREDTLKRMQALAGATGAPSATGNAQRSSGPSTSWAGRVIARVKPNIAFTDTVAGNPEAVVTVRLAPDGTIVGKRLAKSSGIKAWDEAVLRALDKTETLPRDIDGRVPSGGDLVFRPKD